MKILLSAVAALLILAVVPAYGEVDVIHPPGVLLQEEGSDQGRARTLNCVGTGIACTFSSGVGTVTVSSGSVTATQITIDFATCGLGSAVGKLTCQVTVIDAGVSSSSKILLSQASPGAGRQDDEDEMDFLTCRAVPASGQFVLYCDSASVTHSTWKINYVIG